jgi:hypothetical protein
VRESRCGEDGGQFWDLPWLGGSGTHFRLIVGGSKSLNSEDFGVGGLRMMRMAANRARLTTVSQDQLQCILSRNGIFFCFISFIHRRAAIQTISSNFFVIPKLLNFDISKIPRRTSLKKID